MSHRTVGGHLYRSFPKLGVHSRAQLRTISLISSPATPDRAGLARSYRAFGLESWPMTPVTGCTCPVRKSALEDHMSGMSSAQNASGGPAQASGDGSAAVPARRGLLRAAAAARGVPLATIITAVAVVALVYLAGKLIYRLRDVVLMMLVAGFIALILNPLVLYLQRRWIRRRGGRGAQRNAPKLRSLGAGLARPALTVGKGAVSLVVTLGTIAVLVLLLLLEGPKMRRGVLGLLPPEGASRYARIAHEINQSLAGYMVGNLLTSVIAGVVVFVTLTALRIPFPLLWALWVALVDFLPMVGGALAGIPTVLFALGHSLTAGIVTAAVFIAYQQIENHVLNPVVMHAR